MPSIVILQELPNSTFLPLCYVFTNMMRWSYIKCKIDQLCPKKFPLQFLIHSHNHVKLNVWPCVHQLLLCNDYFLKGPILGKQSYFYRFMSGQSWFPKTFSLSSKMLHMCEAHSLVNILSQNFMFQTELYTAYILFGKGTIFHTQDNLTIFIFTSLHLSIYCCL